MKSWSTSYYVLKLKWLILLLDLKTINVTITNKYTNINKKVLEKYIYNFFF